LEQYISVISMPCGPFVVASNSLKLFD